MNNVDGQNTTRDSRATLLARSFAALCLVLSVVVLMPGQVAWSQSSEDANAGARFIWVGGGVSGYYLQYGALKNLGITGYVDMDSVRKLGMETEGRWLELHQTNNIHAETYLAGPRYHFNLGRFQPYVKGLSGLGEFNFTYNYAHGRYFVIAPGGGFDYRVNRRLTVRTDFEYQYWPQFTFGPMSAGGASVGIRYLIVR